VDRRFIGSKRWPTTKQLLVKLHPPNNPASFSTSKVEDRVRPSLDARNVHDVRTYKQYVIRLILWTRLHRFDKNKQTKRDLMSNPTMRSFKRNPPGGYLLRTKHRSVTWGNTPRLTSPKTTQHRCQRTPMSAIERLARISPAKSSFIVAKIWTNCNLVKTLSGILKMRAR